MVDVMTENVEHIFYSFIIAVPRILVVLSILPFLTQAVMPTSMKTAFSMTLSLAVTPLIVHTTDFSNVNLPFFFLLAFKEVLIGLVIGFIISVPFWAISSTGFLVDLQRGAFSATLFSPFFKDVVSSTGILLIQGAATLLFLSGGFLALLEIIYTSYAYLPVDVFLSPDFFNKDIFIDQSQRVFKLAFILAAPMVILMFCIDFTLGIANKFVPELNVFFISLPIKSLVAMLIMALYIPTLFGSFGDAFTEALNVLRSLVAS